VAHIETSAVTAEVVEHFRDKGWARIPGLFSADLADELRDRVGRFSSAESDSKDLGAFEVCENPRFQDRAFRSCAHSAELGAVVARLGGQPMRLMEDTLFVKYPQSDGGGPTAWHQDLPYMAVDRTGCLTIWVALSDVPADMGSLRFMEGSHRYCGPLGKTLQRLGHDALGQYPWLADKFTVSPPLALHKGDATVHDGLTVHSAPPNRYRTPRYAYALKCFPASSLYTGARSRYTDGLGLTVDQPFEHPNFPVMR